MRFSFKKIAAIGAGILLTGMSIGLAAAAPWPGQFVQNGVVSNVAIVYGANANILDATAAGSIQNSLTTYATSSGAASSTPVSVNGAEALDQGSSVSKIWLNTTLTNAKTIYQASDLPTVLGSSTFSGGSVTAQVTEMITMGSGNSGSGSDFDNSGKVIFDKQPTGSYTDPAVGLSLTYGNSSSEFYNESVQFSQAINFTSPNVQGQTITLFGNQYVVSSASSTSNGLVLYSSAQTIPITQGNSSTVTVNGVQHTITLGNGISSTQVTLSVDGVTQVASVGSTYQYNTPTGNVNVAVTSAFPSSGISAGSATVLVGANQLTFQNATSVQVGSSNNPIMGTMVYLTGSVSALTGINIEVQAAALQNASILPGQSFVDPVFGTFQIINNGLSIPANVTSPGQRDIIKVGTSGYTSTVLTYRDLNNNSVNSFAFANNASGFFNLSTPSYQIYPFEMANMSLFQYTVTGTGSQGQLDGHIVQLTQLYNSSGSSTAYTSSGYLNDKVTFTDVATGNLYNAQITGVGTGTVTIDSRQYGVTYGGPSGGTDWAQLKFPSADSGTSTFVVYPMLSTSKGAQIMLYEPLAINMTNWSAESSGTGSTGNSQVNISNDIAPTGIVLPNGAGYTTISLTYANTSSFVVSGGTVSPTSIVLNTTAGATANNYTNITVGNFKYDLSASGIANMTNLTMYAGYAGPQLTAPAVILVEAKDVASNQSIVILPLSGGAGSSSSAVSVGTPVLSASTQFSSSYNIINSNWIGYMDYFGTLVIRDSTVAAQPVATIYYPQQQVYDQLYIGPVSASGAAAGGSTVTQLGSVLVKDTQISSVANDNLIVVGGSCINAAAATLVGGAYCGSSWTTATGIGSGQFLIQSFSSPFQTTTNGTAVALLVAGYDIPDTTTAATYLITNKPDTSHIFLYKMMR